MITSVAVAASQVDNDLPSEGKELQVCAREELKHG